MVDIVFYEAVEAISDVTCDYIPIWAAVIGAAITALVYIGGVSWIIQSDKKNHLQKIEHDTYVRRRESIIYGIAELEMLREEVSTGISIYDDLVKLSKSKDNVIPYGLPHLPHGSYDGPKTLERDIITIVREIIGDKKEENESVWNFHIHIKNYFEHIRRTVNQMVDDTNAVFTKFVETGELAKTVKRSGEEVLIEWKAYLDNSLKRNIQQYEGALFVKETIDQTIELLKDELVRIDTYWNNLIGIKRIRS